MAAGGGGMKVVIVYNCKEGEDRYNLSANNGNDQLKGNVSYLKCHHIEEGNLSTRS